MLINIVINILAELFLAKMPNFEKIGSPLRF